MKKILTILISAVMLVSLIPQAFAYSDTTDKPIEIISGLGLMNGYDDGTFLPDNTMSRAEFAQVIANIYESGDDAEAAWKEQFFKDENEETSLVTKFSEGEKEIFSDVPSSHWAFNVINTVYGLGLMTGVSETEFDPESTITVDQAYKVMICLLGYRPKAIVKGGYPAGYRRTAVELGLSSGIKSTDKITRGDVARMLYNALDEEILQITSIGNTIGYETIPGDTFSKKILGYDTAEGRMTDNGLTDLMGASSQYKETVTVNDVSVRLTDDTQYIRNFIGRDVKIFYKENEKVNYAVYAYLTDRDEVTSFEISDFSSYKNNTLAYTQGKSKTQKTVKLENGAGMILNGTGVGSYDENTFKSINKGTVTVIKPFGKSASDLILLESYTSFYVDLKDNNDKKLYSISTLVDNKCIDLSDEEKSIYIYDANGDLTTFDAITTDMVLSVSESEKVLKLYIGNGAKADATVTEISESGGNTYITCGNDKYVLSKDYIDLKGTNEIKAGTKYTLYIDKFGEIINAKQAKKENITAAIIIGAKTFGTFGEDSKIKYFTEDSEMKESYLADSVKIKNENGIETTYKEASDAISVISSYSGVARIGLNEEKEVNYVELAGIQTTFGNEENRLVRIKLSDTVSPTQKVTSYYKINQGFGGKAVVGSNTKVFKYNPETMDDDSFSINTVGIFANDNRYDVYAYTTTADSKLAEYIVYESAAKNLLTPSNKDFALVKDIYKGVTAKGDSMNILEIYFNGNDMTKVYCEDSVLHDVRDIWDRDKIDDNSPKYKVEKGDIIRYTTNSDETLKNIVLIFDENAVNPYSGGQGNLAGSIGYFDSSDYTHSNPYAQTVSGFNSNALYWTAEELRNMVCYPLIQRSGQLTVTTMDLTKLPYSEDEIGTKYATETYTANSNVVLFRIDGDTITRETISPSEIKTYEKAGSDCDRLFYSTRVGQTQRTFAIRGYTK